MDGTTQESWNTGVTPRYKTFQTHVQRWPESGQLDHALSAVLQQHQQEGHLNTSEPGELKRQLPLAPGWARETLATLARWDSHHFLRLWRLAGELALIA